MALFVCNYTALSPARLSSARLSSGPTCPDMRPWTDCTLTCFLFFSELVTFLPYFSHIFSWKLVILGTPEGSRKSNKTNTQTITDTY